MLEEELQTDFAQIPDNSSTSVAEGRNDLLHTPSPKRQRHNSLLAVVSDILGSSSTCPEDHLLQLVNLTGTYRNQFLTTK